MSDIDESFEMDEDCEMDEEMDDNVSEYSYCSNPSDNEQDIDKSGDIKREYEILPLKKVLDKMNEVALNVSDIIQLSTPAIRVLLRIFKWDSMKMCEKFYEYGNVEAFLEAHVDLDLTRSINDSHVGLCEICFEEGELRHLKCGHEACSECWSTYVDEKVKAGTIDISCIGCAVILNDEQVATLIKDEALLKMYHTFLSNAFVNSNRLLKWCPGANCNMVIELTTLAPQSIFCQCGEDICPACNQGAHLPLSCQRARDWKDGKRRGIEDSSQWMDKYTRPCPKCDVRIQKEGGCNFMQCTSSSCKAFFCWSCMKEMKTSHQAHECGLQFQEVVEPEETDFNDSKATFIYHRRIEAKDHKDLHKPLYGTIFPEMWAKGCTEVHTNLVAQAAKALLEGRRTLAYLHACQYYLKKNGEANLVGIIDMAGADLKNAVWDLGNSLSVPQLKKYDFASFEQALPALRLNVSLTHSTKKAVLECCAEAVEKGLC